MRGGGLCVCCGRFGRGLRCVLWRGWGLAAAWGGGVVVAQEAASDPLPLTEQVRLADGLYSRGLYALALEEYGRLIGEDPPPKALDVLSFRAGECARRLERPREAVRYYLRVVALDRSGEVLSRARYRLADLLLGLEKPASALIHVEALLASDPEPGLAAPAGYLKARILGAQGEGDASLEAYRRVWKLYPEDPIAAYAALEVSRRAEDPEERARMLRSALEKAPSPDVEVEALWGLARLARERGDSEEAAERFWQLWRSHPDSARVRGNGLRMAWSQLQAGAHERALALWEGVPAERREADGESWLYLEGVARARLEQGEEAVRALERHRERYSSSRFRASVAYELAALYAKAGAHGKVLALRKDLERMGEREGEATWLVAESARAGGRWEIAMEAYDAVAEMDPKREPRAVDAAYLSAWVRDRAEEEGAEEAYRAFARAFPGDARAASSLHRAGALALEAGREEAALADWERALALDPDHARAAELRFRMAMVDLKADRNEPALRRLEAMLVKEPDHAAALYWSGVALERLDREEEAISRLREALAAGLEEADGVQARLRLGVLLRRGDREEEAVKVLAPLVAEASESVPDGVLLWLFRRSEAGGGDFPMPGMAEAMSAEGRSVGLRELGAYALARQRAAEGELEGAVKAWEKGLAFGSESVEAVEAGLALGRTLQALDRPAAAKEALGRASRLASGLERGRLQVEAMMGLAEVEEALGKPGAAARLYMGVAVLYEDPDTTPVALRKAAEAFRRAGEPGRADEALRELEQRTSDPASP